MNYYFFPQIPPLRTTLTLSNFPPTTTPSWESQSVYVHSAFSTGTDWKVSYVREIASGDMVSLGEEDLPEQPFDKNSVFFFMNPKRLPERLEALPISDFMESDPNWRGNIQLSSETTSVSYQGEYPGYMLNSSKGKLLTFNPLIQTRPEVITQLIVVALLQSAEKKEGRLVIVHQASGKVEREDKIISNTCNLIDLTGLQNDFEDPLCLYSPDMVGIPIFLSYDPSYRFLSMEHSVPLYEITAFGDNAMRQTFLRNLKSHWINFLDKNVSH